MKSTTRDGVLRGGQAVLIRLLILTAAGISAYLLSVSLRGGHVAGCGPGSACDEVLQSRWAYVLGLPVSALALAVDLALLLTTFSCGAKSTPRQRRGAWEILMPSAVLVLGAGFWFTALQAFVLHRFCPWCLAAHACGALAAVLLLLRVPVTDATAQRDKDPAVSRARAVKFAALAIMAVALLGVAQCFVIPETHSVTVVPAPKPGPKFFDLFGGGIRLDLGEVPLWGSPDAPHKLISLFDYSCHHCRDMHEQVAEVQRSFAGKLAVISLPMPLDAQCNYLLKRGTPAPHTNACTYAKIGLAVWRAKREALVPFDDWLFASPTWRPPVERPPALVDVTNKAVELVGAAAFEQACRDSWIEAQIRADIRLYETNYQQFRQGDLPQFLIGTNLVSGTLAAKQLRPLVERNIGAVAP